TSHRPAMQNIGGLDWRCQAAVASRNMVMKVGLQRQLTYKRLDGSYSAFASRTKRAPSSRWIDSLTGQSVSFLLSRQERQQDSSLSELSLPGFWTQASRAAPRSASHGLTAFICMSLMDVEEAAIRWPKLHPGGEFSSYDAALSAYLLRRAQASTRIPTGFVGARSAAALTTALSEKAETDSNGGKYWSTTSNRWGRRRGSVEATGWALIGCSMKSDATEECLQILRWLSDQQNSLGGFSSSQATVTGRGSNGLSIIRLGLMPPKLPPKSPDISIGWLSCANRQHHTNRLCGYSAGRLPEPSSSVAGLKPCRSRLPNDGACVSLHPNGARDVPVLKLSRQQISLQMYYNADRIVSASYLSPELQELTRLHACPECPDCSTLSPDTAEEPGQPAWLNWLV
uniref:TED_complement domain-containing protein n=1 Tax=Macrostomum lignano TaxID=282301 RepID=A0A1I8FN28_9PLAT